MTQLFWHFVSAALTNRKTFDQGIFKSLDGSPDFMVQFDAYHLEKIPIRQVSRWWQ